MRRLLRILLNAATVVSLVLCAAITGLWVRSYRAPVPLVVGGPHGPWRFECHLGEVRLRNPTERPMTGMEQLIWMVTQNTQPVDTEVFVATPGARPTEPTPPMVVVERFNATARCGSLAALTAALPALSLTSLHLRRRRVALVERRRLCPACGYDLRATPGRCPECGTARASSSPEMGDDRRRRGPPLRVVGQRDAIIARGRG
jgi:predicted Zn-ribbon and HTH transcriptional regulator